MEAPKGYYWDSPAGRVSTSTGDRPVAKSLDRGAVLSDSPEPLLREQAGRRILQVAPPAGRSATGTARKKIRKSLMNSTEMVQHGQSVD